MKISFICMIIKNYFQNKGLTLGLVLKQDLGNGLLCITKEYRRGMFWIARDERGKTDSSNNFK